MKCPVCGSEIPEGVTTCSSCGVELQPYNGSEEDLTPFPSEILGKKVGTKLLEKQEEAGEKEVKLGVRLLDFGEDISLEEGSEFVFGRSSASDDQVPDVDLCKYDAYELGVSRRHAVIKQYGELAVICDLDSSNGTKVNGQKIMSGVECLLAHGDIVHLGNLRLQIIIQE